MCSEYVWGQLVSLTDFESDPIEIKSDKFSVGRATDCDLSFPANKLMSGHHCYLERGKDGKVMLHDTSTNGTLLNMTYKLTKGKSKELQHGDEFYIVYKKDNEELNVGFMFQDTEELKKEEERTQEYSSSPVLDATLEDSDCNHITPEKTTKKRKSEDEDSTPDVITKKPKVELIEEKTAAEELKDSKTEDKTSIENEAKDTENNTNKKTGADNKEKAQKECSKEEKISKLKGIEKDDIEENLQCMICQEIMHDCISLQPCLHSFCSGCYSDWMSRSQECPSCRKKVERINKNHIVNNLIEAYLKEHPAKRRPKEDIEELNKKNKITHDMLYPKEKLKANEDSSEYSDTDDDDDDDGGFSNPAPFPFFRPAFIAPPPPAAPAPLFGFGTPVFGVTRAFKTVCRQCPEYKEPDVNVPGTQAETKTGGNQNQTKPDNVTGPPATDKPETQSENKEPVGEEGPSASDAGESGSGTKEEPASAGEPSTSGTGEAGPSDGAGNTGAAPKPFKDDPKIMPTPPAHVCQPNQNHVLCQCCLQPFPDFRIGINHAVEARPQQCGICYRAYCHAYWGCRKADCLGCLNKFKEMNFGRKALNGLILDNQFESEIFKDYIDSKGLSVKDVLQECCRQMDAGKFSVPAQGTHRLKSETPVCYACGLNNFKQLAFQYRKTLNPLDLPAQAQNRPDCYWGSKCRTQRNKPHHARNFNHICDQTRQF